MRTAYNAPALRRMQAPYDRARVFLHGITGAAGTLTPFGESLAAQVPTALEVLQERSDFLAGLDDEALRLFPELTGECDE